MDTRTQKALEVLAQAVEADTARIIHELRQVKSRMDLMAATRAVNGLSNLMRTKATEIQATIDAIEENAAKKAAELRGQAPRPVLVEVVDEEAAEAVREARKAG